MSNNLNLTQLATNQASPETPINDATAALDAALTEILSVSLASASVTLTSVQFRKNIRFNITGAATTRTVGFPQIKRGLFAVFVDTTNTGAVSLVLGSTTIPVFAGRVYLCATDGTTNGLVAQDIGGVNEPYDLHLWVPGVMSNAQKLMRMKVVRPFTLPINLTGSFATALTAATAGTTLTLNKNGSSIGTIVFAASASTATFTFTAAVSFVSGDLLDLDGPGTADATLAGFTMDLLGTR